MCIRDSITYSCEFPSLVHLDDIPNLAKLWSLRTSIAGIKIKIIPDVAHKWQSLGDLLLSNSDGIGSKLELIKEDNPGDPRGCCRDMFQQWILGNGVKPYTWRKLIEVMQDCGEEALAGEIQAALLTTK